jgi:hypothetical protein
MFVNGDYATNSCSGLAQSVFLTVAVTLERHQSVCNPVEYEARVMAR